MSALKTTLKQFVRPLLRKPWDTPTMEFRYGLWLGVSALYSEAGRQLGEESARPLIFNRHIPSETHACKYDDTRHGKMINISALRIAMRHFEQALAISGAVRHHHMDMLGLSVKEQPGIWDLYIISRASIALIAYQVRVQNSATDHKVSNVLASQYQFISGVFMICRHMISSGHHAIKSNTPISSLDLYGYASENEIFTSPNGMVCAGSTTKILEFLEFVNHGGGQTNDNNSVCEDINASTALLNTIVSSVEAWFLYTLLTIDLDCVIEIEALRQKAQARPELGANIQESKEIYISLQNYCLNMLGRSETLNDNNFVTGVLKRQNEILKLLNKPTLKSIPAAQVTERLGTR